MSAPVKLPITAVEVRDHDIAVVCGDDVMCVVNIRHEAKANLIRDCLNRHEALLALAQKLAALDASANGSYYQIKSLITEARKLTQ